MRVSVDCDDPDFTSTLYRVSVDGEVVKECFAFDTDHGYADVYERDQNGSLIVEGIDKIKLKRIHGTIRYETSGVRP